MLQSCSQSSVIPPVIRVVSHVVDVYMNKALSTWARVLMWRRGLLSLPSLSKTDLDTMSSGVFSYSSPRGFVQEEL